MPEQGKRNRPLSTCAKLALSDWPVLARLITHYSTPIQKTNAALESTKVSVLSDNQINEAFQGPFGTFLKDKVMDFASLAKVKSKHITSQQEMFKRDIVEDPKADVNGLTAIVASQISIPTLDSIFSQLEHLTHEHNEQWIEANKYWKNGLTQYFSQSNMPLAEIELEDFMTDVSATELLKQFTELKLNPPKTKLGCNTFGSYLKLKSSLAVYSSLSRRLQAHTENDVTQFLKSLVNYFSDIEKYEKQMLDNQHAQTNQVLQAVAFALPPA